MYIISYPYQTLLLKNRFHMYPFYLSYCTPCYWQINYRNSNMSYAAYPHILNMILASALYYKPSKNTLILN